MTGQCYLPTGFCYFMSLPLPLHFYWRRFSLFDSKRWLVESISRTMQYRTLTIFPNTSHASLYHNHLMLAVPSFYGRPVCQAKPSPSVSIGLPSSTNLYVRSHHFRIIALTGNRQYPSSCQCTYSMAHLLVLFPTDYIQHATPLLSCEAVTNNKPASSLKTASRSLHNTPIDTLYGAGPASASHKPVIWLRYCPVLQLAWKQNRAITLQPGMYGPHSHQSHGLVYRLYLKQPEDPKIPTSAGVLLAF